MIMKEASNNDGIMIGEEEEGKKHTIRDEKFSNDYQYY